ncbi:Lrp/AsnC ligand binding domain-containing protein [Mesorhizobium sp. M1295]|uniref:Lrp/AsnC ligand binding domain-containing protein n=1 Tax=Mesorhizobium sp. M1295 TaxID=2957076 RepID=UPI00333BF535
MLVELDRICLELVERFKRLMQAATEVTECYLTTGSADFVLVLAVDDVEAFKAFVNTKLNTDSNVRKFKSMIALDLVKVKRRATP